MVDLLEYIKCKKCNVRIFISGKCSVNMLISIVEIVERVEKFCD